jgi:hypothetical protein
MQERDAFHEGYERLIFIKKRNFLNFLKVIRLKWVVGFLDWKGC